MAWSGSIRSLFLAGAMLGLAGAGGPASAGDIYGAEADQFHDLAVATLGADQLGDFVAQPVHDAWQQIPTSTDRLTDQQENEFKQLKSGTIEYIVEIPPEEREEGGPTHRVVNAPAPFGGLDNLVEVLSGGENGLTGSQFQSTDVGDMSSTSFLQNDLGNALGGNGSGPAGALTGAFQGQ